MRERVTRTPGREREGYGNTWEGEREKVLGTPGRERERGGSGNTWEGEEIMLQRIHAPSMIATRKYRDVMYP